MFDGAGMCGRRLLGVQQRKQHVRRSSCCKACFEGLLAGSSPTGFLHTAQSLLAQQSPWKEVLEKAQPQWQCRAV